MTTLKNKIDSGTFFRRTALVIAPLLFAGDLICKFTLDKTTYIALVQNGLLIVYATAFFIALFETVIKPRR